MELDFDKEIDALLRQKDFSPPNSGVTDAGHLETDEISAFADNALPAASRGVYMRHLATCDRCRKILSNVISLNAESQTEADPSAAPVVENAVEPWYRSFLRFPALAYAMGGLTIVFAGFLAFSIMQNSGGDSAIVSQISEAPQSAASGPNDQADYLESFDSANTAANSNAMSVNKSMPIANAAANAPASTEPSNAAGTSPKPIAPPETAAAGRAQNSFQVDGSSGGAQPSLPPPAAAADSVIAQQSKGLKESARSDLALSARKLENLPPEARTENQEDSQKAQAKRSTANAPTKALSGPRRDMNTQIQNSQAQISQLSNLGNNSIDLSGRRNVAGRNFEYKQGVWYDTAFSGQGTINVRRGTAEYKKLDTGLRNAADKLGGTVVIIWNFKAYRIQ